MKKRLLTLPLVILASLSFGQSWIYCTGTTGSYQSGWTDGVNRYDDTIRTTGTTKGGYAVFDLSFIPAGSVISSVDLVFYTDILTAGTAGICNTYGYNGDLSTVTDPATLFADLTSGTLLFSGTGSSLGGYGLTSFDSISMASTTSPLTSFIGANAGSKASICFTGGGTNEYRISGYYGTYIPPHLKIGYTAPCAGTPGGGYITTSNSLSCNSLTTTISNVSSYPTWGNSFQWQSSPDSVTWTNITGETNQTYVNSGITALTYFRDAVTCSVSGLTGYSAGKKINYAACCTGMPTPGAATASTTFCDGCTLTLNVTGYIPQPGLTNQWQLSVDSASWYNVPPYWTAFTSVPCSLTHKGTFYYRDLETCTLAGGLTSGSAGVYVGFPYSFTSSIGQSGCSDPFVYYNVHGWSPDLFMVTIWGDGTKDSTLTIPDSLDSHFTVSHHYGFPGTYSVKEILYNNSVPVDSQISSYTVFECNLISLIFFNDTNANCTQETGEFIFNRHVQLQVDSNGIIIDTIACTSGVNFRCLGPTGTVYRFTILDTNLFFCSGTNVFQDTLLTPSTSQTKILGLHCTGLSGYDLFVQSIEDMTTTNRQILGISVGNNECSEPNAIVNVVFSPKYAFSSSRPLPDVISGNTLTWNLYNLTKYSSQFIIIYLTGSSPIMLGDTIHTCATITPIASDDAPSNNTLCVIDSANASYDPNEMSVSPSYCLPSDTATVSMQYTINFTNVGNDTAFNIYVLDTLPDYVDPMSMRIVAATDSMFTTRLKLGGHNVVKFEFPGINLLDTGHCSWCSGGVVFSVNLKPNLPDGTVITNQAGVYFDYNPVCMTNSVSNITGCWVNGVKEVKNQSQLIVYPNPATDELNITTSQLQYNELTITNSMGQTFVEQAVNSTHTAVNISKLAPGLYFITLSGDGGSETHKFVKM